MAAILRNNTGKKVIIKKRNRQEIRYLRTDSVTEVIQGLKEVSEKLERVLEDSYQWKWVILTLDNLIQNTMVITLRDSAGINILRKKIQKPMAEALRNNSLKRPIEKLDEFLSLYEATKGDEILQYTFSKKYVPKGTEEESIKKNHIRRNDFIHFIPKHLLTYLDKMPFLVLDCMEYLRFLIFNSFNFAFLINKSQERVIKSYMFRIKKSCKRIRQVYEPLIQESKEKYEKMKKLEAKKT